MLKNILIMPIDDRPCHNNFIIESCKYAKDLNIEIVPKDYLGHFKRKGSFNQVKRYLLEKAKTSDTLIISTDGLIYGGLIQARSMDACDLDEALNNLNVIREIKKINPNLKILVYSIIMRLTTSVTSNEAIKEWENIFEYSKLAQKIEVDPSCKDELEKVISNISEKSLNDYLNTRKRNHEVNKACIELLNDGVIDYLALVQEDTNEYGLHRKEQEILYKMIKEYDLSNKCIIKNGADEMAALLLAREINTKDLNITLETKYLDSSFIARYEDTTSYNNILAALKVANIQVEENENNIVMLTLPAKGQSLDLCFETLKDDLNIDSEILNHYKKYDGRNIAILDVQNSNGGDIRDIDLLYKELSNSNFVGYSAWNTASNSIGTLILDIVIANYYEINKDYLDMRIVDDAIYQGLVRKKYNDYLKDNDIDIWSDASDEKHMKVLESYLNEEVIKHPMVKHMYKISLPWGRTFEAELEIK